MARPKKRGLDYFPLDVDVFDDDKLFDVQNEYGPLGETVYLRLVCLVYKNGYYFKFDSIEKLAAMVIRSIGSRWVESKREIAEIIEFMIKCGLFSERFFKMNILTSKGIQTRFKLATERRRSGIVEYSLIDGGKGFAEDVHENVCGYDISPYDDTECSGEDFCGESESGFAVGNSMTEKNTGGYSVPENNYSINRNNTENIADFEYDDMTEENTNGYYISENDCMAENNAIENICDSEYCGTAEKSICESNKDYYYNMCDFNDYFKNNTDELKVTYDTFEDSESTEIVSAYENGGFCCNNPTKKSKEKESKVNKSKLNESKENESIFETAAEKCSLLSIEKIVKIFNKVCSSLPKVTKITEERVSSVKTAEGKINGDFEGLFKRVEKSDFLTGRNGKWLNCSFDWILKPCNLSKILNGNYDNPVGAYKRSGGFYFSNEYENEEEYYESLKKLSPCY